MNEDERRQWEEAAEIRRAAMAVLKSAVTGRFTQTALARWVGCSPSWVGVVLRGGYPYSGGAYLPKNIRVEIEGHGIAVPDCLKIH
jgi:hypothetical protein